MVNGKPLYVALHQPKHERRAQLEAYHNARQKNIPPQAMYGNQAGNPAMYGNMPRMMFPQQMAPWNPAAMQNMANNPNNPMANMMRTPMNYQLMPAAMAAAAAQAQQQQQRNVAANNPNARKGQQVGFPPQMMAQMMPPMPTQDTNQLDIRKLAKLSDEERTQMIGETLFPKVKAIDEVQAGKITGMLLEMDNSELLMLLDSEEALKTKVHEAREVLAQYQQQQAAN